jgi:hypothetical protein
MQNEIVYIHNNSVNIPLCSQLRENYSYSSVKKNEMDERTDTL